MNSIELQKLYQSSTFNQGVRASGDVFKALSEFAYEISSEYPSWFNEESAILLIAGICNVGFKVHHDQQLSDRIYQIVGDSLYGFGVNEITDILWLLIEMGVVWSNLSAGLQAGLLVSIKSNSIRFNPQMISNTLFYLSKIGVSWLSLPDDFQIGLLYSVEANLVRYNSQDISNTLLALNQMGVRWSSLSGDLRSELLCSVESNMNGFDSQEIANSLLGLNQMGCLWSSLSDELHSGLLASAASNASEPKAITHILDALNSMGVRWLLLVDVYREVLNSHRDYCALNTMKIDSYACLMGFFGNSSRKSSVSGLSNASDHALAIAVERFFPKQQLSDDRKQSLKSSDLDFGSKRGLFFRDASVQRYIVAKMKWLLREDTRALSSIVEDGVILPEAHRAVLGKIAADLVQKKEFKYTHTP